jgi:tetratricopeptide (TPR) repeat protein
MFKAIQTEELSETQRALLSLCLGNCYFRAKKYAEAIETYTMEEFPGELERQRGQRQSNLASCFAKLKKYELSLKAYNEAVRIYSKYPDIDCSNLLNNVGIIYMSVQMFKSAEKYFMNSIE